MEVVMGLQPRLPQTLSGGLPVQDVGVPAYVTGLLKYLEDTYHDIKASAKELASAKEADRSGSATSLAEGMIVLRRKPEKDRPSGSHRFEDKTDGVIYRIHRKNGVNSYELELLDGSLLLGSRGRPALVSGDLLVLCDMPELEVERPPGTFTRIEIQDRVDHNVWRGAVVDKFLADGQVVLRYDDAVEKSIPTDLTKHRYRWLH